MNDETKDVLFALNNACELYSYVLNTQEGIQASEYLKKRNIEDDMIEYFSLGYCPSDGESSIKLLRGKNISIEALDKAGIIQRNNNVFVDRFKGRLIFPLFNEYKECIGFSARRIVDNDEAKYVNSINSVVFNKSKVLYNYQNALKEAKKEGYVYITEGFMDVFSLYKVGIKSSVAIMGTAFTEYHAKMIKKLNVEARLCLDGDDPGQHGILNMIPLLQKEGIKFKVVNYKDSTLDPDEILQKYGPDVLRKFLNRLISHDEFIFQYHLKRNDVSTSEGKRVFSNLIIDHLKNENDFVNREIMLKKLSDITSISVDSYLRMLGSISHDNQEEIYQSSDIHEDTSTNSANRYQRVQDKIIKLMLNYESAIEDFNNGNNYFNDKLYDDLANYIVDYYSINKNMKISDFITYLSKIDNDNSKLLLRKVIESQDLNETDASYSKELMNEFLKELAKENDKSSIKKKISDPFNGLTNEEKALELQKYLERRGKKNGIKEK